MMKTQRLLVQKTVDDMLKKSQRELNHKKNLIITDINSKEESLIAKLKQNPKNWNTKSLKFNLRTDDVRDFSSAVNFHVTFSQVRFHIDIKWLKDIFSQQLDVTQQPEADRKFAEQLQQSELIEANMEKSREWT